MSIGRIDFRSSYLRRAGGYTLVEILIAATLTLMLMTAVVRVFSGVGDGISKSRKALEAFDRLRSAAATLRQDLSGVTVTMQPPWRPEEGKGYFEYIEGGDWQTPVPPIVSGLPTIPTAGTPYTSDTQAYDSVSGLTDTTAGERGDILMFTTRNASRPFSGLLLVSNGNSSPPTVTTMQSDVAEVAWFIRGHTLHRRVLLVSPGTQGTLDNQAVINHKWYTYPDLFFGSNDISVRLSGGRVIANSLGDLAKRENRFAHPADYFPFDARRWGMLGLPTMLECSSTWMNVNTWPKNNWKVGTIPFWNQPTSPAATFLPSAQTSSVTLPKQIPPLSVPNWATLSADAKYKSAVDLDLWQGLCGDGSKTNFWIPDWYLAPGGLIGKAFSTTNPVPSARASDDVILTNVLGFDVKAWDPGAPLYADPVDSTRPAVKPGDADYVGIAKLKVASRPAIVGYGAYVDLGWAAYDPNYNDPNYNQAAGTPLPLVAPRFWHYGQMGSNSSIGLSAKPVTPYPTPPQPPASRVYDTFPSSYENEGIYHYNPNLTANPPTVTLTTDYSGGTSSNGFDNNGNGIVNDTAEQITSPPYPVPLRGIQVKIRVFEPDSRQVREVTIEQDFLPK